jgi:hypothetical protein
MSPHHDDIEVTGAAREADRSVAAASTTSGQ